jgi:uncharacterized protein YggE
LEIRKVSVTGIYFTLDQQKTWELESKARRLAVEDAVIKGQQVIEASNLRLEDDRMIKHYNDKLGPVIELSSHPSAPRYENVARPSVESSGFGGGDSSSSVPISPGKKSVTYSFDIKFNKIVDADNNQQ